ncbi:4-hydroxyphenylacetate catabolism regulatory protein HpaA [Acinetobacter sp. ANC 3832]|uniref:4-hydroxyphenylacetate catabolism regulatory protein HpaA n=1 Tax=Acinetobacter sp. ANC 3832 TaxID=1977874 RepID=UPI000A35C00B|nr:4-hydroxyphenylacetate catabolism regulatory protein HpaA [Acinetobacter sp. ANC 3832]OTG93255.1 4-hydroxyphenylacetate catabolism regulatory protein HpaA [Acinetobacter sp. ANC 3832]
MKTEIIPNLHMGDVYDHRYAGAEIHYEAQAKLANFFGQHMPPHRHDRFFQLHVFNKGTVRVFLDDVKYVCQAPAFFLTPPSVAHSFITDPGCDGHVLTIQQNIIWPLLQVDLKVQHIHPICLHAGQLKDTYLKELFLLETYLNELKLEFESNKQAKNFALKSLINLIFLQVMRLAEAVPPRTKNGGNDLTIFRKFNELIESNYDQHWSLTQYAQKLTITETRLNDICRRLAEISSKKLIYDRQMQEAKRLLIFTDTTINSICYQLGFKDPAYFSRFFHKNSGLRPSEFRQIYLQ